MFQIMVLKLTDTFFYGNFIEAISWIKSDFALGKLIYNGQILQRVLFTWSKKMKSEKKKTCFYKLFVKASALSFLLIPSPHMLAFFCLPDLRCVG